MFARTKTALNWISYFKRKLPRHEQKNLYNGQVKVLLLKRIEDLAVCLSISFYFTSLKGELQNRPFKRVFAFDQRTAKQVISIEIFLSITKILRWFDVRNYEKRKFWFKYLVQFRSFWQLFLLKWLQSPFSWGQVLMKH